MPTKDTENSDHLILRVDTLELKIMDLEHTIQTLNDAIVMQLRDIERLQLQQTELLSRLSDSDGEKPGLKDEIPPHY